MVHGSRSSIAGRAALALGVVCLGLLGALAVLLTRGDSTALVLRLRNDDAVRAEVVRALLAEATGAWDAFPDADVGRVLQPDLSERAAGRLSIRSNSFGMRDRPFVVPKPAGVVRVILLGDSYVFGNGVAEEERCGRFLEEFLQQRRRAAPATVECLHAGITGWNLLASSQWLRRQLSALEPDLVIHVSVSNDLDDCAGVHGFGELARFSPRHRERADGLLGTREACMLHPRACSLLEAGLDLESRARYAEAAAAVTRLAAAVEGAGGRYLLLLHWPDELPVVARHLAARLAVLQVAWLPSDLHRNPRYRVSSVDAHWNAAGHRLVATLLYGLIQERDLLPDLALPAWEEAADAVRRLHDVGRLEAAGDPAAIGPLQDRTVTARIDFEALTADTAGQVHGGIDAGGRVAPYASLVLRNPAASRLYVRGSFLDRPEIDGGRITVLLDDLEVGTLAIASGEAVEARFAVPARLRDAEHVSVRFIAQDYAYVGRPIPSCVAFRLRAVALED